MARHKRRAPKSRNAGFEKKLVKYAVAGGAILGAPLTAHAGIIYSGILEQTVDDGQSDAVNLPGGANFELGARFSSTGSFGSANRTEIATHGVMYVAVNSAFPDAMAFGDLITIANATANGTGTLLTYGTSFGGPLRFKVGNWPHNGSNAFLGFAYTSSSSFPPVQLYAGWAQINVQVNGAQHSESVTLVDYAYQDAPNVAIAAGDIGTPEPSSLATFAIGGAAMLELLPRRR